jgi:hypothetical protein
MKWEDKIHYSSSLPLSAPRFVAMSRRGGSLTAEVAAVTSSGVVLLDRLAAPTGLADPAVGQRRLAATPPLAHPDIDPDRGSSTVARHAARDQLTAAAGRHRRDLPCRSRGDA